MTKEERIKALARLYCHYMEDKHQAVKNLYTAAKEAKHEVDFVVEIADVEDIDNIFIEPLLDMLRNEGVRYMEEWEGKTRIFTVDDEEIVIDEIIHNPFRIDFPYRYVYDGEDENGN